MALVLTLQLYCGWLIKCICENNIFTAKEKEIHWLQLLTYDWFSW